MALVRAIAIVAFLFLWAEMSGAIPGQQPSEPVNRDSWSVLAMYPVNGTLMGSLLVKNSRIGCVIYAVFSKDAAFANGRPDNSDQPKSATTHPEDTNLSPATFEVFAIPRCSNAELPPASTVPPASLFGLKWRLYHKREPGKGTTLGRINVREQPLRPWHEFGSDFFGHYTVTVSRLGLPIKEPLDLCAVTRWDERICVPLTTAQFRRVAVDVARER